MAAQDAGEVAPTAPTQAARVRRRLPYSTAKPASSKSRPDTSLDMLSQCDGRADRCPIVSTSPRGGVASPTTVPSSRSTP